MTSRNTIALVFDCDETLCVDTTDFLLLELNQDPIAFWQTVTDLVRKSHWDPPLAYITRILALLDERRKRTHRDVIDYLRMVGSRVEFYEGVENMIAELPKIVQEKPEYRDAGINLEFYIVSGGFEELIKGTELTSWGFKPDNIVACSLGAMHDGKPVPKSIVTFTEKTKYLYAINKGIPFTKLRGHPDYVNVPMSYDSRPIPFENIIYVGDGFSDVPCFSMLNQHGGVGIGVFSERAYSRGYQLAISRRIMAGPYRPDYRAGRDIRLFLEQRIKAVADSILEEVHEALSAPESALSILGQQSKLDTLRKEGMAIGLDLPQIRLEYQKAFVPPRSLSVDEEVQLIERLIQTVSIAKKKRKEKRPRRKQ